MAASLVVRAPAKINLTLRVGAARPDGYHDVHTLLQSLALADTLTITPRRGPFAIQARAAGVPTDRTNLIWRAAGALWRALGRDGDPRDTHVRLDKAVPVAAGLGGGSADAAAALVGLHRLWQGRLAPQAIADLAAGLGADVPFGLQGGTAVGVGRGEIVYPVLDINRLGVILVKPSFGVTTADAYRWLDEDRRAGLEPAAAPRPLEVGWPQGPIAIGNDLQAPVARRHPAITEMVDACLRAGAMTAAMTGSGSAVFGVFRDAAARTAVRQLARPDWLVTLTRTIDRKESQRLLGGREPL
jgi:4-diphosphocytidyl-2-C-methyl-D-erythritol kinase